MRSLAEHAAASAEANRLALAAQAGDAGALEDLLAAVGTELRVAACRTARRGLPASLAVDDLLQEATMVALRCVRAYDSDRGSFFALLRTALRRHLHAVVREQSAFRAYGGVRVDPVPHDVVVDLADGAGGDPAEAWTDHLYVDELLAPLPALTRTVLWRCVGEGRRRQDVAAELGIRWSCVVRRVHRGLRRARKLAA